MPQQEVVQLTIYRGFNTSVYKGSEPQVSLKLPAGLVNNDNLKCEARKGHYMG